MFRTALFCRLEDSVRKQVASILRLEKNSIVRNLGNAGKATGSSLDTDLLSVTNTAVNCFVAKSLQTSFFHTALRKVVRKSLAKSNVVNDLVAT